MPTGSARGAQPAGAPRRVRVALVGCGAVARLYYAPALQALERAGLVRVAGLYDPDPGAVAALAAAFPAAARLPAFEALARLDADLAIVASPPRDHREQTVQALRWGMAVLCEKPMAATVPEAEAMLAAARETGALLAVSLHRRFFPATRAVRDILQSGRLGEVRSVSWREGRDFRWPARSPSLLTRAAGGGGVLMDLGVHVLDLLVWWLGEPAALAYADDAMGGIEANCRLTLDLAGGGAGEVRLTRDWPSSNQCAIECRHGRLVWEANEPARLRVGFPDAPFELAAFVRPGAGRTFLDCFTDQVRNAAAAVAGLEPLAVPPEAALASLRLIERCYRERSLLAMPWLSAEEQARAGRLNAEERARARALGTAGNGAPADAHSLGPAGRR